MSQHPRIRIPLLPFGVTSAEVAINCLDRIEWTPSKKNRHILNKKWCLVFYIHPILNHSEVLENPWIFRRHLYLGYCPLPRIPVAFMKVYYRDSLPTKNGIYNPGGDWHPGKGDNPQSSPRRLIGGVGNPAKTAASSWRFGWLASCRLVVARPRKPGWLGWVGLVWAPRYLEIPGIKRISHSLVLLQTFIPGYSRIFKLNCAFLIFYIKSIRMRPTLNVDPFIPPSLWVSPLFLLRLRCLRCHHVIQPKR